MQAELSIIIHHPFFEGLVIFTKILIVMCVIAQRAET
jgi:hypothetical protein